MHRPLLPFAVLACLSLAGCTGGALEPANIDVYAAPTSTGTGWVYRDGESKERILHGSERHFDLKSDASALRRVWAPLHGEVAVEGDDASDYIVIRLDDRGTARSPLLAGTLGWDLGPLTEAFEKSLPVTGTGSDISYSVHLKALEFDKRPGKTAAVVAQVRLREIADRLMERGVDPRVITGQVIPYRETPWRLMIELRPYRFGSESVSARF